MEINMEIAPVAISKVEQAVNAAKAVFSENSQHKDWTDWANSWLGLEDRLKFNTADSARYYAHHCRPLWAHGSTGAMVSSTTETKLDARNFEACAAELAASAASKLIFYCFEEAIKEAEKAIKFAGKATQLRQQGY